MQSGESWGRTFGETSLQTHSSVPGVPIYQPYTTVPFPVPGRVTLSSLSTRAPVCLLWGAVCTVLCVANTAANKKMPVPPTSMNPRVMCCGSEPGATSLSWAQTAGDAAPPRCRAQQFGLIFHRNVQPLPACVRPPARGAAHTSLFCKPAAGPPLFHPGAWGGPALRPSQTHLDCFRPRDRNIWRQTEKDTAALL